MPATQSASTRHSPSSGPAPVEPAGRAAEQVSAVARCWAGIGCSVVVVPVVPVVVSVDVPPPPPPVPSVEVSPQAARAVKRQGRAREAKRGCREGMPQHRRSCSRSGAGTASRRRRARPLPLRRRPLPRSNGFAPRWRAFGEGDEGKDEPKSKRTPHLPSTSIFSIAAMYELGGRHVTFSDAISKNIRPYDVLPVSMISFAGEVYPGAPTGIKVLRDIGLTARFSMAIGLSSSTEGGTQEIGSSFLRFRGGLKWRFVPGTEQGPVLAISGEFGLDQFTFEDAGALAPQVPAVDYQYVRAGGEARFPLGPVALELGGGYRGLLGVGETGGRFRDTSALAFDVLVGFYVPLPAGFEVRLQGDYTRVFYAFKPVPGDEYVAGGAVDEMLGARLGVAYVY